MLLCVTQCRMGRLYMAYMSCVVRKLAFCICENRTQISFAVTVKLISAFVFATRILQSLLYLNPKFQVSSHLLLLYSLVCVGPGRKPRRPVFSQRGSYLLNSIWISMMPGKLKFAVSWHHEDTTMNPLRPCHHPSVVFELS